MRLELAHIKVEDVVFGAETALKDHILTIDREALLAAMDPEGFFVEKRVTLVKPGQSAGSSESWTPCSPAARSAAARVLIREPSAICIWPDRDAPMCWTGSASWQTGTRQGIQEGIVDMSGPGAAYSLFSRQCNVVLECLPPPDVSNAVFDEATRRSLARAALYLGETAGRSRRKASASLTRTGPWTRPCRRSPTFINRNRRGRCVIPMSMVLRPEACFPRYCIPMRCWTGPLSAAITSSPARRIPVFCMPTIRWCASCTPGTGSAAISPGSLSPNENSTLADKKRSADFAVKLAQQLGAQGVVLTQEGGRSCRHGPDACRKGLQGAGASPM